MNLARKKRLWVVLAIVFGVGMAVALALSALKQNINLFYTPSQIAQVEAPTGVRIRAGGLVERGSLTRDTASLAVSFRITDGVQSIWVRYQGILPDLFREGQGVVALGQINAVGQLVADEVLAKHDEKYMPPEVAKTLQETGLMKHYESSKAGATP